MMIVQKVSSGKGNFVHKNLSRDTPVLDDKLDLERKPVSKFNDTKFK